ncbi:MAG: nucleoside deaminase [Deltaproteobacteria bacterium]|nr:nucleoside deaminase [Deltaproteobacteria bacterium]
MRDDISFMREALSEAEKAFEAGEIPVGALIVNRDGKIIARGMNLKETTKTPIMHAEIVAIIDAHRNRRMMYLTDSILYTTLEPCPMCAGALVNERISEIVFAAEDKKYGACGSVYNIASDSNMNHRIIVTGGVLRDESVSLINKFFARLRETDA